MTSPRWAASDSTRHFRSTRREPQHDQTSRASPTVARPIATQVPRSARNRSRNVSRSSPVNGLCPWSVVRCPLSLGRRREEMPASRRSRRGFEEDRIGIIAEVPALSQPRMASVRSGMDHGQSRGGSSRTRRPRGERLRGSRPTMARISIAGDLDQEPQDLLHLLKVIFAVVDGQFFALQFEESPDAPARDAAIDSGHRASPLFR